MPLQEESIDSMSWIPEYAMLLITTIVLNVVSFVICNNDFNSIDNLDPFVLDDDNDGDFDDDFILYSCRSLWNAFDSSLHSMDKSEDEDGE